MIETLNSFVTDNLYTIVGAGACGAALFWGVGKIYDYFSKKPSNDGDSEASASNSQARASNNDSISDTSNTSSMEADNMILPDNQVAFDIDYFLNNYDHTVNIRLMEYLQEADFAANVATYKKLYDYFVNVLQMPVHPDYPERLEALIEFLINIIS